MGIPDPTIDPITGLPILDTSPIVQQIPLGRQTVDYDGWSATAHPTRVPLYPDDVIPVFANVQGQHPEQGNAQNVHTDGHNALLVKDVGGGSSIDLRATSSFEDTSLTTVLSPTTVRPLDNVPTFIQGFMYSCQAELSTVVTGNSGRIALLLVGHQSGVVYYLAGFHFPTDFNSGAIPVAPINYSAVVNFDVSAIFAGDTEVDWQVTCADATIRHDFVIFQRP